MTFKQDNLKFKYKYFLVILFDHYYFIKKFYYYYKYIKSFLRFNIFITYIYNYL